MGNTGYGPKVRTRRRIKRRVRAGGGRGEWGGRKASEDWY